MDGEDLYKPAGGTAVADKPAPPPAAGAARPPRPPANTNLTWTASEYIEHQRGASWYFMLAVITAALAGGTYFLTKDYFAIAAIVIVGIIVGVFARRKPRELSYELNNDGLRVGEKIYSYSLFKSFAIVRDGQLNSVQLLPIKRFMPPISAYFSAADEEKIVDTIGQYLPYEERQLDAIDRLSRRLRF